MSYCAGMSLLHLYRALVQPSVITTTPLPPPLCLNKDRSGKGLQYRGIAEAPHSPRLPCQWDLKEVGNIPRLYSKVMPG